LTNLSFALAKLVPGSNGSPSRWINYVVTTVPSTTTAKDTSGNFIIYAQRPGTDNTGTLVDNGDGSYRYTFYRDVPKIKDIIAAAPANPDTTNYDASQSKGDLDDLTYDPSLVHRLTIQVSGNAPGTGTNTPTGAQVPGAPAVVMTNPKDAIYDFTPSTGAKVTDSGREIVATAKCEECHRKLGGIAGDDPESSAAGFHGGGRNNTQYCVVCHTEQRKFGRKEATYDTVNNTFVKPASTTGCGNGTVTCTYVLNGRAVGNLPNHIHKTHMGEFLGRKGYEYAGVLYISAGHPQLHEVPRRLEQLDREDGTGQQLDEQPQPPGLRFVSRSHRLRDRQGHDDLRSE
jgi:OmcA/MtrC family decaheme c-type cytochrome